jgi:hypothetical protein
VKSTVKPSRKLVLEYHYADGDVGAHPVRHPKNKHADELDACVRKVWATACPPGRLTQIIIRRETPTGD